MAGVLRVEESEGSKVRAVALGQMGRRLGSHTSELAQKGGCKVLVPARVRRDCVNFFLPAVIHR